MNDIDIAKAYLRKAQSAADRGLSFGLSFVAFKNLMRAKRCKYTGIELTEPRPNMAPRSTDRTIDRVDSTIGYESGNVVAACHSANQIKSVWENPNNPLTAKMVIAIAMLCVDGGSSR